MTIYLLKFSACLLIFWLVYVLFLERQNMHRFKRFYLLGTLVVALVIPTVTITEYVETVVTNSEMSSVIIPIEFTETEPIAEPSFFTLEHTLWLIYGLGVLLFFIRFLINLVKMQQRIYKNETISKQAFVYVLLHQNPVPHSFFKYLFFNKTTYESNNIPKEVKLHEETHAKQLHSLDIMILEFLQIVFWFHPFIYILKHHIKLNHEFLADQAVLNYGSDAKTYQNILLQFSSSTQDYSFSSAINYSSIKKRFTVMKTQTSKTRIWISTLLVLPVIAILFFSFAERVEVEKATKESNEKLLSEPIPFQNNNSNFQEKPIMLIQINRKGQLLVNDEQGSMQSIETQLKTLTKTFNSSRAVLVKYDPTKASKKMLKDVRNLIIKYDFKVIHVDASLEAPVPPVPPAPPAPPAPKKPKDKGGPNMGDFEAVPTQQKATKKQVETYNVLAKKYNLKPKDQRIVKLKDLNQLESIYKLMSKAQKDNAQPFPECPPPPVMSKNSSFQEFIEDMEKQGASFYLDGKKISSNDAKYIAKNNKGKSTEMVTQLDDNGKYMVKLSSPKSNKPQKSILPIVNGEVIKSGKLALNLNDIRKLKLTLQNSQITAFKVKIPGVKTEAINGNTITKVTLENLKTVKTGDVIAIFDINDDKDSKFSPVVIEIKDKI